MDEVVTCVLLEVKRICLYTVDGQVASLATVLWRATYRK